MLKLSMLNEIFHKLITSNMKFNDKTSYRRVILVNTILFLTVFILLFFTFFNYLTEHYVIGTLDAIAATVSFYALIHLRIYNNVNTAAKIATSNLGLFFLLFAYTNGGDHFGMIWTIFLPIFAILVNGRRVGLYFSIIFYSLLYYMAYNGISVWAQGQWQMTDFLRLFFSSVVLTYAMYVNEFALEESDNELTKIREREKEHIEQLQALTITDELTTLYNRRHFNELAPKLLSLAKRKQLYLTVLIIDIDHFKSYNDNYGHHAGDIALTQVASVIKHQVQRDDDFVFRLGGDEFAGITLSEDPSRTHEHIASICKLVEALKIEHKYSSVSNFLTTSIGITTVHPDMDYSLEDLYKDADKNLYKAKENGKNQSLYTLQED